jgi:oxygen-dependent protoporphyrinogen oxidase
VVHGGRLRLLPKGFYLIAPGNIPAFLASPLFSPLGKLRMLAERWVPRSRTGRDESIASFVRRRFGREALERVGQPMIAGVYSGDPEELSLESTMGRFHALEAKYGSVIRGLRKRAEEANVPHDVRGVRYSLFVSFRNGMQTITDALQRRLPAGVLRTGFQTVSVTRAGDPGRWTVLSDKGERVTADVLCLAVSARQAAACLKDASPDLAALLGEITYESVATLNLAFEASGISHPLDGFGFVVPNTEGRPLMACTFVHRKFPGRAPQGQALLRAFVGGAFGRRVFHNLSDAEIEQAVLRDLDGLIGLKAKPLFSVLQRHAQALPQYRVGHRDLLRRIERAAAALPGLVLTGSSYRGSGIPDCVRDAERCAEGLSQLT